MLDHTEISVYKLPYICQIYQMDKGLIPLSNKTKTLRTSLGIENYNFKNNIDYEDQYFQDNSSSSENLYNQLYTHFDNLRLNNYNEQN